MSSPVVCLAALGGLEVSVPRAHTGLANEVGDQERLVVPFSYAELIVLVEYLNHHKGMVPAPGDPWDAAFVERIKPRSFEPTLKAAFHLQIPSLVDLLRAKVDALTRGQPESLHRSILHPYFPSFFDRYGLHSRTTDHRAQVHTKCVAYRRYVTTPGDHITHTEEEAKATHKRVLAELNHAS